MVSGKIQEERKLNGDELIIILMLDPKRHESL